MSRWRMRSRRRRRRRRNGRSAGGTRYSEIHAHSLWRSKRSSLIMGSEGVRRSRRILRGRGREGDRLGEEVIRGV